MFLIDLVSFKLFLPFVSADVFLDRRDFYSFLRQRFDNVIETVHPRRYSYYSLSPLPFLSFRYSLYSKKQSLVQFDVEFKQPADEVLAAYNRICLQVTVSLISFTNSFIDDPEFCGHIFKDPQERQSFLSARSCFRSYMEEKRKNLPGTISQEYKILQRQLLVGIHRYVVRDFEYLIESVCHERIFPTTSLFRIEFCSHFQESLEAFSPSRYRSAFVELGFGIGRTETFDVPPFYEVKSNPYLNRTFKVYTLGGNQKEVLSRVEFGLNQREIRRLIGGVSVEVDGWGGVLDCLEGVLDVDRMKVERVLTQQQPDGSSGGLAEYFVGLGMLCGWSSERQFRLFLKSLLEYGRVKRVLKGLDRNDGIIRKALKMGLVQRLRGERGYYVPTRSIVDVDQRRLTDDKIKKSDVNLNFGTK